MGETETRRHEQTRKDPVYVGLEQKQNGLKTT